jgi:branched-subunit amino acid aminotransferase/4-amino-4-deoxychorismate lyase
MFDRHAARFAAGCAHFGLRTAPDAAALERAAAELARSSGLAQGVLRWSAWRRPSGEGWGMRIEPPRPHTLKPSWRAAVSQVRLPPPDPDRPFKHLGRRAWAEALAEARAAGWDEVLLADGQDRLVEGAVSNVFCVLGGRLRTPDLGSGPLPGLARARVLELAAGRGIPAEETPVGLAELDAADEVFLTNALAGPVPLSRIGGRELPAPGPVASVLRAAWLEA